MKFKDLIGKKILVLVVETTGLPAKKIGHGKDNYYDYVLCSHVIEDFANPIPLIDELIRITKVNGLTVFTV